LYFTRSHAHFVSILNGDYFNKVSFQIIGQKKNIHFGINDSPKENY